MKVSCLQENLSKGLGIVGRAVGMKSPLPITGNILISTEESRLKLAATNLEIGIVCWIGAKVEDEGSITVPAQLLTDFVNSLPNDRVDLEVSARTNSLTLRCARFEAKINGLDAQDFPPIPAGVEGITARIEPATLHEAISQVAFAAATDDTRPVLAGVYVKLSGSEGVFAAADGFRLSVRNVSLVSPLEEEVELIIPAKTLAELNRILGEEEETVEIVVTPNRNQVVFHLANVNMVSQLIQGTFPNYPQLIPPSFGGKAIVNTADFLKAAKTASIFARENGIVRIQGQPGEELVPGKLIISARGDEVGENVGEVDAIIEGEATRIAFNAKYLLDLLRVVTSGQLSLQTNSPSSPGAARPVGRQDFVHVIMPMFVQW
ncbi:MAG: DNA polymerase III subunit beta [Chloroflexi bacterium]|nr:DNA polymerase III subunit beta [Chloroflexota bacterium]